MNSSQIIHKPNSTREKARAFDEMQALWTRFGKSEEILQYFRTVSSTAVEPDAELLRRWEKRLVLSSASAFAHEPDQHTPNVWFAIRFPAEVEKFGKPFLERQQIDRDGLPRTELLAINEDFFAATLGGDKSLGHQVIFYEPEKTFHFWDCAKEMFLPVTAGKLALLVSNRLLKCGQEMSTLVNVEPLYTTFRSTKCMKGIMQRAEAIHQADESFFQDQNHPRIDAPAREIVPKLFVREGLAKQPKAVLTVNDCFEDHLKFCDARGLTPLQRKEFKGLIAEVIREEFGVGLRHDLRVEGGGRTSQGWSNVAVRRDVLLAN